MYTELSTKRFEDFNSLMFGGRILLNFHSCYLGQEHRKHQ